LLYNRPSKEPKGIEGWRSSPTAGVGVGIGNGSLRNPRGGEKALRRAVSTMGCSPGQVEKHRNRGSSKEATPSPTGLVGDLQRNGRREEKKKESRSATPDNIKKGVNGGRTKKVSTTRAGIGTKGRKRNHRPGTWKENDLLLIGNLVV